MSRPTGDGGRTRMTGGRCFARGVILGAMIAASSVCASAGVPEPARIFADYGEFPVVFEPNQGQAPRDVEFLARATNYTLLLGRNEAVLALAADNLAPAAIRMRLVGANPDSRPSGLDPLPGTTNYFIGSDPAGWQRAVPNYASVRYTKVYPGIDLVYHGRKRGLEYDFVVAPGGNPGRIVLDFKGLKKKPALDREGNLVLAAAGGEVFHRKPHVYQDVDGVRRVVGGRYRLLGKSRVGFVVAQYDRASPLVIDPALAYSTYLHDNSLGWSIVVDAGGNAYVTGEIAFPDIPGEKVFIAKLNPKGDALVYSNYMGGTGSAVGRGIAVDGNGSAYVTGTTTGVFPTTPGAYQVAHGGGGQDAFVAKFDATGTELVYSTYLGGSGGDWAGAVAINASGEAYVTGWTEGAFPTTNDAFRTNYGGGSRDVFVTKLDATGTSLVFSTYFGASADAEGSGIAVDGDGNAYVVGATKGPIPTTPGAYQSAMTGALGAFVFKLHAKGRDLTYSTFLGGAHVDEGNAIAVDASGNAYVTGATSGGFPTTAGAFQATFGGGVDVFVTKLNRTGTALAYSTYLGGEGFDSGYAIVVAGNGNGNAYVTGYTSGGRFPVTSNAIQSSPGGASAALVAELDATGGTLVYSSYLGGSGLDFGHGIAVDLRGDIYVTGRTQGDFPTTPGAYRPYSLSYQSAFVARISPTRATVVEYYNYTLDHFFITWRPDEIAILDAGTRIKGWWRTGDSFETQTSPLAGTSPVCRYYIPPAMGDSHFFGRGSAECDATGQNNPSFVLEDPAFMHMFLPVAGVCPASTTPVYRVFNNRRDANHRYLTDRELRDRMVDAGWIAEGDGPDLVVMCAPQ
jgi:hypothetical protein